MLGTTHIKSLSLSQYDIDIVNEDQTQKNDFLSIKMENFMQ